MLNEVFNFWIKTISRCVSWVFSLELNSNPSITFGEFLLAFAFIGIVLYFILGTDFIPGLGFTKTIGSNNNSNNNYQPKHVSGNTRTYSNNYSTRAGRNK